MANPRRIGIALEVHLLYKHHTEVFAGVQRFANERGWVTILDDWIGETLARSPRGTRPYDGIIARVEGPRLRLPRVAQRHRVPIVNVYAGSPEADRLPGVFPDVRQAGRMRAEHLLSRGLQNFACWSADARITYRRQADAFAEAIAEAGYAVTRLDFPDFQDEGLAAFRKRRRLMQKWMDTWKLPIGVALPADDYARQVAQMAVERGWRVPEDVAIVGGMNEEHLCDNPRPSLTSVDMGFERCGYEAAKMLESMMDGRGPREPQQTYLPPSGVVVRDSTDFYASGDDVVSQAQAFIAAQCHTHIDVGMVAAKVCVSIRTLQDRFHEALHRTVGQEIRRARLEKVKRELVGSDRSIHEIAARAGFPSNSQLSIVFKRETGMTPREFRITRARPRKR